MQAPAPPRQTADRLRIHRTPQVCLFPTAGAHEHQPTRDTKQAASPPRCPAARSPPDPSHAPTIAATARAGSTPRSNPARCSLSRTPGDRLFLCSSTPISCSVRSPRPAATSSSTSSQSRRIAARCSPPRHDLPPPQAEPSVEPAPLPSQLQVQSLASMARKASTIRLIPQVAHPDRARRPTIQCPAQSKSSTPLPPQATQEPWRLRRESAESGACKHDRCMPIPPAASTANQPLCCLHMLALGPAPASGSNYRIARIRHILRL